MIYSIQPLSYNYLKKLVVILSSSYDVPRDTVRVGTFTLGTIDIGVRLLSLSILLHFDGTQQRELLLLIDEMIGYDEVWYSHYW
jgi:hypothetical protein